MADTRETFLYQRFHEEKAQAAGAALVSKDELLSRSDAVSIHMVLSPRSRGLIGASDITPCAATTDPHATPQRMPYHSCRVSI
jgi:lactate dehydrogenase-like 2-hydroxyacid dehydrogenase